MIALEILDYFRSEQIANGYTPFLLEMYNEAIAELEALQHRSCEGCIDAIFPLPKTCSNCERNKADLYRPKEQ